MKILKKDHQAISAVIGVILMVAITAAIGAVSYAYFTGLIGGVEEPTPVISFVPDHSKKTLTVSSSDHNINWADIEILCTNTTGHSDSISKSGTVSAGDSITLNNDQSLTGTVTVTFRHIPSNSMLADSFTFQNV
jgi:FlaG/FlaF family flagellin (archaellin)